MPMVNPFPPFMMLLDRLPDDLDGQFLHIRPVAANSHHQPALEPCLVRRQPLAPEQRLRRRRAAHNDVGRQHLLLEEALVVVVLGREHAEPALGPALARLGRGRDGVEPLYDGRAVLAELAVDEVDRADGGAAEHQREADVPVGLAAAAEDGEGGDMAPLADEAEGGECCAEGGDGAGVQDAGGFAGGREEGDGAGGVDHGLVGVCVGRGEGDD